MYENVNINHKRNHLYYYYIFISIICILIPFLHFTYSNIIQYCRIFNWFF